MQYLKHFADEAQLKQEYQNTYDELINKYRARKLLQRKLFFVDFLLVVGMYVGVIVLISSDFWAQFTVESDRFSGLTAALTILPIIIALIIAIFISKFVRLSDMFEAVFKAKSLCMQRLMQYYGLNDDNFIVTKCFACSDKKFDRKDLILFVCNDELRIINDITHAFNDLGCYCLPKAQINAGSGEVDGVAALVLNCQNVQFVLAKRAYFFINKNLWSK